MIEFGAAAKQEFLLESGTAFLNHGSFGAAPRSVLEAAESWRRRMEANPDLFLREILPGALRAGAGAVAQFIRQSRTTSCFIDNATAGMNAVLRALQFDANDEILATTHTYGAVAPGDPLRLRSNRGTACRSRGLAAGHWRKQSSLTNGG